MSPRYKEVFIPPGDVPDFEERALARGWVWETKSPLEGELEKVTSSEWSSQVRHTRGILMQFAQEHDPITERAIQSGINNLVGDIASFERRRVNDLLDHTAIRQHLITSLSNRLCDEQPDSVTTTTRYGQTVFMRRNGNVLLPQYISLMLEYYGLPNGQPLKQAQLVERYGMAKGSVSIAIAEVRGKLRHDPRMQELIFGK